MRIISRSTLVRFWGKHPETKPSLGHWITVVEAANWETPQQIVAAFSKAKVLNSERVRFEVAGGNYRLIVAFDFEKHIAYVKFLGTHTQYDRINALTVSEF